MSLITSTANPTIKHIRSLKVRKARSESGQFLIEGIRIVGEAVQLGADIDMLIIAPDMLNSGFAHELVDQLARRKVPIVSVSASVFESLSEKDGPQGIAAVLRQRWLPLSQAQSTDGLCWIALDAPQDPGNIGTIIRTADAVGAAGVMLLGAAADPYDVGAVRASMGALFSVPLVRTDFNAFWAWVAAQQVAVVGTSDRAAQDYRLIQYVRPLVLLMGSERQGLSEANMQRCQYLARIPMLGRSDSLNLAVATGIMLYAIHHSQHPPTL